MPSARVTGEELPRQAVIFAGGRGERLRPLTDAIPKPLLPIHGRPFLDYLLELLRGQGIERVLMLLGYRADDVRRYVGRGDAWGLAIECFVSPATDETAMRLWRARELIDDRFLLLYSDNYWPLQLSALQQRLAASEADVVVTVYRNRDGLTRSNVIVDGHGTVSVYDDTRSAPGLEGVEIGYAIVTRAGLRDLSGANDPFGRAILRPLAERGGLAAFVTDHRYYSIGSHDRLERTTKFLAREPAVILDRDGVLNTRPPQAEYVRTWDEFTWLPGAREALALFTAARFRVVVVTNQPGIARGKVTRAALDEIHDRMRAEAASAGGRIDRIYVCVHGWDDGCECRKPRPGLLFEAQHDFDLDLSRTTFIGDDERDALAAEAAGAPSRLVSGRMTLLDHARETVAAAARAD